MFKVSRLLQHHFLDIFGYQSLMSKVSSLYSIAPKLTKKVSKSLILTILSSLCFAALPALSQKVITSQNGQKIIINPDGTWSDYKEDIDSSTVSISNISAPAHMAYVNKEEDDYELLRTDIQTKFEELKQNQFNNKNNIKVVKEEIKKAKKENRDDLALKRLEERKLQYYLLEYDLEKEMDAFKPFKISVDRLDKQGFDRKAYENLKQNYIAFSGDSFLFDSKMTGNETATGNTEIAINAEQNLTNIEEPLTEAQIRDRDIKRELTYYSFETDNTDVLRDPPEVECKVKLKGIDKRTRKERTELESGYLFGYTHPNIKSYFKEKDYLTCNAKLSKVGGLYYLSFEVRIASIKANKTYGSLDKGSGIRIKLINGETVNLYNISAATGLIEPLTGVTVYQTNYPMEKSEFKMLSKTELDKIGVIWSTGYEEYEIYEVDFLMNQAECLKNS